MKKKTLGIIVVTIMALSIGVAAILMKPPGWVPGSSSIFGPYAYQGGNFFINMVEQAPNGHIAQIYGTFTYDPKNDKIDGTATITIMDTMGNQITELPGTITYTNGVLVIMDENKQVYYHYPAKSAKEAFWKGLAAVYEYEMNRNKIPHWRKQVIEQVDPNTGKVIGHITAYQAEINPSDKFEQMNLGQLGLLGPFKYNIMKIQDPRTGTIISVKLIVLYNNAVIFSQEVGVLPPQQKG